VSVCEFVVVESELGTDSAHIADRCWDHWYYYTSIF
jgi:hypothetical protein